LFRLFLFPDFKILKNGYFARFHTTGGVRTPRFQDIPSHKYRDFLVSARALRRLSDRVCLKHDLSIIQNPKPHSKGKFLHYGQWLGADRRPSSKEQLRAAIDTALVQRPADLPLLTLNNM